MNEDPSYWWYEAFAPAPREKKPPGDNKMLTVIAYDVCDDRRLHKIAKICEDFGIRVQFSVFECYLEESELEELWQKLLAEIDPKEDRIVAYKIDARLAKEIRTAGTMVCSEKVICFLV
ncbi:CRISPR-associated endonuclease Cas2 [Candidatus Methylacidiphilum fumarolicum]|nr:CRISPR-associated endonuclease Cas2 [Candidatus Methylacidiphilum fumarolicum]